MPRGLRDEFAGAIYHVMARGNERRDIFRDDRDRKRFLETLGEMMEPVGLRVLAYCLMPNHYHLVLNTPRANLSQAMGWLQTTCTVRFDRRHWRVGHLFQGRFKAQWVDPGEYGTCLEPGVGDGGAMGKGAGLDWAKGHSRGGALDRK